MDENLLKIIKTAGFKECYALAPAPIPHWDPGIAEGAMGLFGDPKAAYPKAVSILLMVYPYRPFRPQEPIPAYYPASNAAYFAAKQVVKELEERGFYAENAEIPLRAFALANGIGDMGKNGLLRIHPYGSCIVLEAIATDAVLPEIATTEHIPCPEGCTACAEACPTMAIGESRDVGKCMRLHMENSLHPEWVREKQRHYIGCEECIRVCPFNTAGRYAEPNGELRSAFDTAALIRGETSAARKLTGKNMTGGGKLTSEAIAMAGRQGMYKEEVEKATDSSFEGVKTAAEWALHKYFSKT
ncbi:MAG: epoxyqueuosine reductase [Clostridia bacterium]|nr:epoxyqueuosine reductase [Clostridia bacterium]